MKMYKATTSAEGSYAKTEEEAWEILSGLIFNSRLKELNTTTSIAEVELIETYKGHAIYRTKDLRR